MKSSQYLSPLPGESLVPLEAVLCTDELNSRPSRPPDYQRENRALVALAQALADSPRTILQTLADKILEVFRADSAGVSLLTKDDGGKRFYWPAIAGVWKPYIGGGTPRDFGPCGDVLDRNAALMFRHFERRYTYFLPVTPPVEECLLVPFYVEGKPVGTIWAIAHDDRRKFDTEDLRQLESLGRFASAAYQVVESFDALEHHGEALRYSRAELARRVAELQKAGAQVQESHQAALNLMEEAVHADKAMEKLNLELRESEERYRQLMRLLPVAVYTCEAPSGTITFYNDHAATLWGRAPAVGRDTDERFFGSFPLWRTDGSLLPHDQTPMALALSEGRIFRNQEVIVERPDGTRITVLVNIDPVRDETGRVVGAINAFHDTTLLKEFQDAVLQSEERFRSLVSVITDVPWTTNAEGAFVEPQPAWAEYTGQSWEELRGFGWADALHPDDRETIWATWQHASKTRSLYQSHGRLWHAPSRRYRYFEARATPILNPDGSVRQWVGACNDVDDQNRAKERLEIKVAERTQELQHANAVLLRDMDERKKLEEQLLQAQKMESIGVLAGGVAHDFNNILNIIQGYAFILRGHDVQTKEISESLAVIDETIQRGSALVQQLLTLARKTEVKRGVVDANRLLEGLIALIKQTFPKTIELSSDLARDLPTITGDGNQIGQALLNLCVNASDAMPNGGRLTFRTQSVDGVDLQGLAETIGERYVCIEVSDTGMGMDESVQRRIFEPFFTTKVAGKGTGLGLSVVYGIMKHHDGLINVVSQPERGTTFRLYFPAAPLRERVTADTAGESVAEPGAASNHVATVLLVEDEKNMLDLLQKVLLQQAYRVFTAGDGEKGLEFFLGHSDIIDVVLLDLGLPKMAGQAVLNKMKQAKPELKVIVTSGYLEQELQSEIDRMGVKHFLRKPYTPHEVVTTIQSLIETKSQTAPVKLSPGIDRRLKNRRHDDHERG